MIFTASQTFICDFFRDFQEMTLFVATYFRDKTLSNLVCNNNHITQKILLREVFAMKKILHTLQKFLAHKYMSVYSIWCLFRERKTLMLKHIYLNIIFCGGENDFSWLLIHDTYSCLIFWWLLVKVCLYAFIIFRERENFGLIFQRWKLMIYLYQIKSHNSLTYFTSRLIRFWNIFFRNY